MSSAENTVSVLVGDLLAPIYAWLLPDHDWRPAMITRPRLSIDGQKLFGPVMVRRAGGVKEYREETHDEATTRFGQSVW